MFIDDVYSGGKRDASSGNTYPLLSEAIKSGLFHPNCKDSTSTYFEGITTLQPVTEEEQAEMERREQLEQRQSYYENQAKKNRRIAEYSLDADNKRTYAHRAEQSEKKAAEIAEKLEKTVENSGESGIISLWDNSTEYKPVTPESIDKVPLLNIFDDDAMNKAHQEASRDLLREVMKHDDLPLGTEFSIVYDENMQPIKGCGYRQGEVRRTKIDNPGIPYHAFHNHGSGQTFSIPDILNFAGKENMISLSAVGNNGDLYLLISTSMSDKQSYFDYLTVSFNDIIFKTDKREVTLNWLYSSNNSKIVDEYIHSLNPKQKNQLIFAVLDKVNEYLIGVEKFGIKYIKT